MLSKIPISRPTIRYDDNDVDDNINETISPKRYENERVHRTEAFRCEDRMQSQVSQAVNPRKRGYPRWKTSNEF